MGTGLLSGTSYDDVTQLASIEIEKLSCKLIVDFYSAYNRLIKLQKVQEPFLDDSKIVQSTFDLIDFLWMDIGVMKKVSKTNLFSYTQASAKAQVRIPPILNTSLSKEQIQLKLGNRSGATCQSRE